MDEDVDDPTTYFPCANPVVDDHDTISCDPPRPDSVAVLPTPLDMTSAVDWSAAENTFRMKIVRDGVEAIFEDAFQYEGPVITGVTNISHWGDELVVQGRNFGPALASKDSGTNAKHMIKVYHNGGSVTYDSTDNVPADVCGGKKYRTLVVNTVFCGYLPNYLEHSGDKTVQVAIIIANQESNKVEMTYRAPEIDDVVYASHLGGGPDGIGSVVTVTGRFLVPRALQAHLNPTIGDPDVAN
jgi:hypothetical protein